MLNKINNTLNFLICVSVIFILLLYINNEIVIFYNMKLSETINCLKEIHTIARNYIEIPKAVDIMFIKGLTKLFYENNINQIILALELHIDLMSQTLISNGEELKHLCNEVLEKYTKNISMFTTRKLLELVFTYNLSFISDYRFIITIIIVLSAIRLNLYLINLK